MVEKPQTTLALEQWLLENINNHPFPFSKQSIPVRPCSAFFWSRCRRSPITCVGRTAGSTQQESCGILRLQSCSSLTHKQRTCRLVDGEQVWKDAVDWRAGSGRQLGSSHATESRSKGCSSAPLLASTSPTAVFLLILSLLSSFHQRHTP